MSVRFEMQRLFNGIEEGFGDFGGDFGGEYGGGYDDEDDSFGGGDDLRVYPDSPNTEGGEEGESGFTAGAKKRGQSFPPTFPSVTTLLFRDQVISKLTFQLASDRMYDSDSSDEEEDDAPNLLSQEFDGLCAGLAQVQGLAQQKVDLGVDPRYVREVRTTVEKMIKALKRSDEVVGSGGQAERRKSGQKKGKKQRKSRDVLVELHPEFG